MGFHIVEVEKVKGRSTPKPRIPAQLRLVDITSQKVETAAIEVLVQLWASFYIEPYVHAADSSLGSEVPDGTRKIDYVNRNVLRGALLTCIVDAFQSESILYSDSIQPFIQAPWIVFGPSGDKTRIAEYSRRCRNQVHDMMGPLYYSMLGEHLASPESGVVANNIADVVYHHLLSLNNGAPVSRPNGESSEDTITRSARDSPSYLPFVPAPWGVISRDSLFGEADATHMMAPIALMLREARNKLLGLDGIEDTLRFILDGHNPKTLRETPYDVDLTSPVRRHSENCKLFLEHLPPSFLTGKVGLSNLLSWLGTGQGNGTKSFLSMLDHKFQFNSSDEVVAEIIAGINRNEAILAQETYKPGMRLSQIKGYVPVDNPAIWGQPSRQLSIVSHKTPYSTLMDAIITKFQRNFTDKIQLQWKDFLGDMYGVDPGLYQGERRTWKEALELMTSLNIAGFKNGLTTLQSANLLAFAGIVQPPDAMIMGAWIHHHNDLGAYRGLQALGFRLSDISSVVAAFLIVHNHLNKNLSEEDSLILGFDSGFSTIAVEHILCKVTRWQGRLHRDGLAWSSFRIADPEINFPIPTTPSEAIIEGVIEEIMVSQSITTRRYRLANI